MNAFIQTTSTALDEDDLTDPSDWATTALPDLQSLDFSLRCQICKEFMTAPVLTGCGHSFCSLCIRRCLTDDGKCPVCRTNQLESHLRKNVVLEEAVLGFGRVRRQVIDLAQRKSGDGEGVEVGTQTEETIAVREANGRGRKVKGPVEQMPASSQDGEGMRRSTRSSRFTGSMSVRKWKESPVEIQDSEAEWSGDSPNPSPAPSVRKSRKATPEPPPPPKDDGLAECPICFKRMPADLIASSHIDACLSGTAASTPSSPKHLSQPRPSQPSPSKRPSNNKPLFFNTSSQPKASTIPTRIPKINYATLKETALRAKLNELGIPSYGTKPILQARHTEWVMLVNANADAKFPKTKNELLRELTDWERTRGKVVAAPAKKEEEFKAEEWVKSNRNQYDALLENARKRRKVETPKEATPEKAEEKREGEGMEVDTPTTTTTIPQLQQPAQQHQQPQPQQSEYFPPQPQIPPPHSHPHHQTENYNFPPSSQPQIPYDHYNAFPPSSQHQPYPQTFPQQQSYPQQHQYSTHSPELSQEVVHR